MTRGPCSWFEMWKLTHSPKRIIMAMFRLISSTNSWLELPSQIEYQLHDVIKWEVDSESFFIPLIQRISKKISLNIFQKLCCRNIVLDRKPGVNGFFLAFFIIMCFDFYYGKEGMMVSILVLNITKWPIIHSTDTASIHICIRNILPIRTVIDFHINFIFD